MLFCFFIRLDRYTFIVQNAINLQSYGKWAPSTAEWLIVAAVDNHRASRLHMSCEHR